MATAKATTDHDQIRKWVEARGGHPARVKATGRGKDPGILRIDFPGFSGADTLEEIEWDEFFDWFDRNNLAMLLSPARGNRFNKLVKRTTAKRASSKKSSAKKSSAKKASTSSKKAASKKKASSSSKKTATRSLLGRTTSAKKSSAKKAATKKASTKKAATTKAATKKTATKKASSSSKKTTNHTRIRQWVEARGGFPATVAGTENRGEEAGLLRIDYPGYSGRDTLERIDWDDWFAKFDEEKLAFLHQDKRNSRFSKLVRR